MEFLGKYSAGSSLIAVAIIALFFLLRAAKGYRQVERDGAAEYDFRRQDGTLGTTLGQDDYVRIYKRTYGPRKSLYTGFGLLAAAFLTGPAIRLFEVVSTQMWKLSGRPYEYGPGTMLWQFILFFALIGFWGLVFYVTFQRYHKRTPLPLSDALKKRPSDGISTHYGSH